MISSSVRDTLSGLRGAFVDKKGRSFGKRDLLVCSGSCRRLGIELFSGMIVCLYRNSRLCFFFLSWSDTKLSIGICPSTLVEYID